jgi:hypothetical protein
MAIMVARTGLRALWLLVVLAAVVAAAMLWAQGGFGAGEGRFDFAIAVLALPWCLLPWPDSVVRHVAVWLLMLPLALNSAIIGVLELLYWLLRRRGWFKGMSQAGPTRPAA